MNRAALRNPQRAGAIVEAGRMTVRGVTFTAWRDERPVGLGELLEVLGSSGLTSTWLLWDVEVAQSASAIRIHDLSDRGASIRGSDLLDLAADGMQVINGTFEARQGPRGTPWVLLRAVDGTSWDVESPDEVVIAAFRDRFADASPLPE